jgi:hypothetical protein
MRHVTHDVGDGHHHRDENNQGAGDVHQEGEGDQEDNTKHQQHIPATQFGIEHTSHLKYTVQWVSRTGFGYKYE